MDDALWTAIRRAVQTVEEGTASRMDVPDHNGRTATVYAVPGGSPVIRIDIKEARK